MGLDRAVSILVLRPIGWRVPWVAAGRSCFWWRFLRPWPWTLLKMQAQTQQPTAGKLHPRYQATRFWHSLRQRGELLEGRLKRTSRSTARARAPPWEALVYRYSSSVAQIWVAPRGR